MTILILQTEIAIPILLLEITHKINLSPEIAITPKLEHILQVKTLKDQATLQAATVHTEAAAAVAICPADLAECPVVVVVVAVAVAEEWVAEEDKKH